jgi:hypothetical protein
MKAQSSKLRRRENSRGVITNKKLLGGGFFAKTGCLTCGKSQSYATHPMAHGSVACFHWKQVSTGYFIGILVLGGVA